MTRMDDNDVEEEEEDPLEMDVDHHQRPKEKSFLPICILFVGDAEV